MSVRVYWHDETQRILRYEFNGRWTWDDYYVCLAQGRTLMRSVRHYVGILNDMLATGYVPSSFLNKAKAVIDTRPINTGLVIFLSQNYNFISVYRAFSRLYPDLAQLYILENYEAIAIQTLTAWLEKNERS